MNQYGKYVGLLPEKQGGPLELFNCDTLEDAKGCVEQFLEDNPNIDEVALYELKDVGIRYSTTAWKHKKSNGELKVPKGDGHCSQWTTDEDTYVVAAVRRGYTHREIGVQLGRTTHAVTQRVSHLRCG